MSSATAGIPKTCPACQAIVLPGREHCISCGMQVAKMADFLAAKRAAGRRGIRKTSTGNSGVIKLVVLAAVVLCLVVGGVYGYRAIFPAPSEAWKTYPTDRDALLAQFFTLIQTDTDPSLDQAYALVSQRAKDPNADDEIGKYRQTFHDLARYLNGEFGDNWAATLHLQHDDGNNIEQLDTVVSIQTEKLHIALDVQGPDGTTPAQLSVQPESTWHYGVRSVEGFSVDEAGKSEHIEGTLGALRALGGSGSANQLSGIVNTAGSPLHESPIETKRRLLPIVRDPKATGLHRALHQLWPVRNDPTVRARLESIMGDDRYDPQMREIAKRVHDGTEDDEALIADGVNLPG